ncbi:hypothetical protein CHS0354_003892 [Potamilus streckersoni]|uniref:Uncharacterized protein n=1 Tax=Potamilus streckersoni TaxID=2493646 RepID=A0AAE0TG03_9BIVA|nr:hypothetical protein CHS0354_003892 [Potamilus streckersoni]
MGQIPTLLSQNPPNTFKSQRTKPHSEQKLFTAPSPWRILKPEINMELQKLGIITDSMSALQAQNATKPTAPHNLKEDTLYNMRQIKTDRKTVEFLWVPSLIQLQGKDAADQAAKKALLLNNVTNIGYCIREIYSFIKIHTNKQ